MRITLLLSASLLFCSSLFATPGEVSVYFETDQYVLKAEFREALMVFSSQIDADDDFSILIKGFADYRGSQAHNQLLSMRRAEAVSRFLEEQGLHPFELRIISSGEIESAQSGSDTEVKGDRRVDISYQLVTFSSVEELHEILAVGNELEMKIDAAEGGIIRSTKGTTIHFPAMSMIDAEGNPYVGEAVITLTEALSPLEFFTEGLTTVSGDRMLETDGMIQVLAVDENGEELCISPDAEMTVLIPSNNVDPRMELFVSETGDDWQATGQSSQLKKAIVPNPPQFRFGNKFFRPNYKQDTSTMPRKPSTPVSPRKPKAPVEDHFQPTLKWYDFLWRKKKLATAKRQYEHALARYETRDSKYQKRLAKFNHDTETLEARVSKYEKDLVIWEDDEDCAKEVWQRDVYDPAKKRYDARLGLAYERHQKRYAKWREKRVAEDEERLARLEELGEMNVKDISGYVFRLNSFGWINCDYFWEDSRRELQDIVFHDKMDEVTPIVVAYTNAKTIIRPYSTGEGGYKLNNVPYGEPATVIAYKVENGKVLLCTQELDHDDINVLDYKPVSLRELRSAISEAMGV